MASYSAVETALLNVIKLMSEYDDGNASAGDYRILATGVQRAVVTQPAPFGPRNVEAVPRRMRTEWIINLELYEQFSQDVSEIAARVRSDRQGLIDHIDKYPTLNGTTGVIHALLISGQEPQVLIGENRNWWQQTMRVSVETRQNVTIAE